MCHGFERFLCPIPTVVAIHRVVPAGDGRDAVDGQLGEVVDRGVRRDVAAVGERVDPRLLRRELHERLDVVDVRVDAAVRDEAEQVDVLAALERAEQRGVLEERAVLDRLVHADEILEEDAPGADRQVPDLGVAHLAVREADRGARRLELRVRVLAPEPVEDRRVRQARRRCRGRAAQSPSRRG